MSRPLVLIHGYSADAKAFNPLREKLLARGITSTSINICNYISLNNEINIKDIAEGLDRAFRKNPELNAGQEFDAVVHSTGMLVLRSWLTNYRAETASNARLRRLKHLIGLAPATWGSPQAHKGRTWLGALVKGNHQPGPDFLNAGDRVLEGLELGSSFTWELSHQDLIRSDPYYDRGPDTPYVAIFIGNSQYVGIESVANDPGTDGTVRWAGCALNTRKIIIDLTRAPIGPDGKPSSRKSISPWAESRLDIPIIPVDGKNHSTILQEPEDELADLLVEFLKVSDEDQYDTWLKTRAKPFGDKGRSKMLVNPGSGAGGIQGEFQKFFGHLAGQQPDEGWQQFVIHAKDERGDGITDYMMEVLMPDPDNAGQWKVMKDMYTDVHAYGPDTSFRCFHVRLPQGITQPTFPLKIRFTASTGTELMAYRTYSENGEQTVAVDMPVELDLADLGGSLFQPFTTTLIEIIINREPLPFDDVSRILSWEAFQAAQDQ